MKNPYTLRNEARENITNTEQKSISPVEQTFATIGDVVVNILEGAVKNIEGTIDATAMTHVGIWGDDIGKSVSEFVKKDYTADIFGKDEEGEGVFDWTWGKELSQMSALEDDHIVNNIAEGIGGMLPAVALSFIPYAGPALAMVSTTTGAGGNAAENALNEDASFWEAFAYGGLSAGVEFLTEKIGGKVIGKATGSSDTLLGKLASKYGLDKFIEKGAGKVAYNFVSEGVEEVLADIADPWAKRISGVDENADVTVDTSQLLKTFVVGGAVGAIMDGVQNSVASFQNKSKGGKHFVNISNRLENISDTTKAMAYLQQNKNFSQERMQKATVKSAERMVNAFEDISTELKAMKENQRAEALKTLNNDVPYIADMYEQSGALKEGALDGYQTIINNGSPYNVSSNFIYDNKVIENVEKINQQKGLNLELSDTKFNKEQRQNFAKLNKNLSGLSKKSGKQLGLVVVKTNKNLNALIDGNTIYIGEEHLNNGKWAKYLAHEVTHFAENSKEYRSFAKFISKNEKVLMDAVANIIDAKYDFSYNEVQEIVEKIKNGETDNLTAEEQEIYTEIVAHIAENIFSDEKSIERIAREDRTLAQKILNRIKDFLQLFKGTNADRDVVVSLRKAEMLFERALNTYVKEQNATSQYLMDKEEYSKLKDSEKENWLKEKGYKAEDFNEDVLGEDEEYLDNSNEVRYSFKGKKTARYINKKLDTPTLSFIRNELRKMYGPIDSAIADGIAIEKDKTIFVVDSGIEDGHIDFGVLYYIEIADDNLRYKNMEEINDRAVSKGHVDNEISKKIRRSPDNGSDGSVQRELQKELSDNTRKSENNESGISEGDGFGRGRRLKLSLKDSNGNTLTTEQAEYFKDSKVRDDNGNLLVVYHGSPNKFTEFSHRFMNTHGNAHGKGFYFTEDIEYAKGFEKDGGQILKGYLNISKPASETEVTISKAELIKLIKATCEAQAKEFIEEESYDNMADALLDTWVSNYVDTYSAYSMDSVYRQVAESVLGSCENDVDILAEMSNGGAGVENVLTIVRKTIGYDGIIFDNGNGTHQFVSFESNQFKNVTNKTPTESKDIRFSKKSFSEQVDDVLSGKDTNNTHLQVRENTPKIFLDLGLDDKPMLITSVHTKTAVNQKVANKNIHKLSVEALKRLPKLLESPAIVFDSTKKDSIVAFVNAVDEGNNPVMCAININGNGFYNDIRIDTNLISSVYGKDSNPIGFIEKAVDEDRILYWNKKISQDLFSIPGLQLPDNLLNLDSNIIIRKSKWIVNTNLKNSTQKLKFSLKDTATYTLSDGQVKKKLADFTKLKVYSKVEAERIINSILETNLGFEDYEVKIAGKTKEEVIDVLWQTLNTADAGRRTGISLKIADYIIDNSVIKSIYAEEENQADIDTIQALRPYLHSIDLSHIRDDIKSQYGNSSPYLLWGKRKGTDGITADKIANELAEEGFYIDATNEADIFFEIDSAYRNASKNLKQKSNEVLKLNEKDRATLRQDIAKEILRSFDDNGKKTKLADIIEKQEEKAKVWKELYYEEKQRNSAINHLLDEVEKIRNIRFGDFQNSSQYHNILFRGSIEKLSAIKNRGDLNKSGTRRIVGELNAWYRKDNPVVTDRFNEEISYILNSVSSGEGKLTAEEIRNLANAVTYFRHFIETANKIYRAGKYVEAKPIAEKYVKIIDETKNIKVSWFSRLFDDVFNNKKLNYMQTFNDPMTVARYMDKYEDGFFTETIEELRDSAVKTDVLEMELSKPIEEFYKKHKKYLKGLDKKTIKYNGVEIPYRKALYVYMAFHREEALLGLARSGFEYKNNKDETFSVDGFATDENLTLDDIKFIASNIQTELENQFTETDLEYIKLNEDVYSKCKDYKKKRDINRLGYSNVTNGYYVPIRRAYIAGNVDIDSYQFEVDRVSNLSFNKSTVKGAKNELFVEDIDVVLSRHIKGIARYYHLSNAIDNFNIIYNIDLGGNLNKVKSVKSESKNIWSKGEEYIKELLSDIQGVKKGKDSKLFSWLRGNYAKYQLGANPKVWITQLSSFFASSSILDNTSIIKGLVVKSKDVDKYCPLAELRNTENSAALSQGVLEETGKIGDFFMKPIGFVDRFVVVRLFGACQVQIQKNTGLAIGTEENKVKAGDLLQKVILETQQNSIATERSKAMRSTSELMKTLTMFTSDSMKVIGRVIDSWGKLSVLKAKRKATTDSAEIAKLDKQIKTATKEAAKSTSALITSAIFMAVIAQAFRTLYNKDDEDENIVENMVVDTIGNLLGGLPLIKDLYSGLVEGYDFDGYQYSAINDLIGSFGNIIDVAGKLFSGDATSRDIALSIKKLLFSAGQVTGIPVRNLYNVTYGLTKRISPETAYQIDDLFYKQGYSSDLKKAIENNDEDMINTIAGLIMNENIGAFENGTTRKEINRLVGLGYNALPQSVGDKMTINEVEYSLSETQKKKFKEVYSGAIPVVDKLVTSKEYARLSDEEKANAIKYVYNYYRYKAQQETLGVELDSKLFLFGEVLDINRVAPVLAYVSSLKKTSDEDKKAGKSRNIKAEVLKYMRKANLTATEKYMLMGYFGYKNTEGEAKVKSLIRKSTLTTAQQKLLLEKCGY